MRSTVLLVSSLGIVSYAGTRRLAPAPHTTSARGAAGAAGGAAETRPLGCWQVGYCLAIGVALATVWLLGDGCWVASGWLLALWLLVSVRLLPGYCLATHKWLLPGYSPGYSLATAQATPWVLDGYWRGCSSR